MSMLRNIVEQAGGRPVLGTQFVGLLAAQILAETATGPDGSGLMYNDGLIDGKRYRLLLETPTAFDGRVYENGSFSAVAPTGGRYRLYEDNLLVTTPVAGNWTTFSAGEVVASATIADVGDDSVSITASAADLSPGGALSDAEMRQMFVWINELAKIHGLVAGTSLIVTPTTRTAGTITQSINEVGSTVTVMRTP